MAFRLFSKKAKKKPQKRLTNPGGLVKVVKRGEERQRTESRLNQDN
jgi:predicted ATPase